MKIDLGQIHDGRKWDHVLIVRGMEFPLLSPNVIDASKLPTATTVSSRRSLRRFMRLVTHRAARRLIRRLTPGEMISAYGAYIALMEEWFSSVASEVAAMLPRREPRTPIEAPSNMSIRPSAAPQQGQSVTVRPGGRLPAELGGHAVGAGAAEKNHARTIRG